MPPLPQTREAGCRDTSLRINHKGRIFSRTYKLYFIRVRHAPKGGDSRPYVRSPSAVRQREGIASGIELPSRAKCATVRNFSVQIIAVLRRRTGRSLRRQRPAIAFHQVATRESRPPNARSSRQRQARRMGDKHRLRGLRFRLSGLRLRRRYFAPAKCKYNLLFLSAYSYL